MFTRDEQRGDLLENAREQLFEVARREERPGRADHLLESLPLQEERPQVAVRPEPARHGCAQPPRADVGLRVVVVDVVALHHGLFRREACLPRPEDDAHGGVAQRSADPVDELQSRLVGLHHDVEQQQGGARPRHQHGARLGGRGRVEQRDGEPVEAHASKREARHLVYAQVVVHREHRPAGPVGWRVGGCRRLRVLRESECVVVRARDHRTCPLCG